MNDEYRFWQKVDLDFETGCWNWTGGLGNKGYGYFWYCGKTNVVHRYSYQTFVDRIPPLHTIDHLCRNHRCVNPKHLQCITNKENVLIGIGITAINARKTHCIRGHSLSGDNLHINKKGGGRRCKTCNKMYKSQKTID